MAAMPTPLPSAGPPDGSRFAAHAPMLLAYCRAICGDHHAAEDAVQDTLLIAHQHPNRELPEADAPRWLRAIARRRALMAGRAWRRPAPNLDALIEHDYAAQDDAATSPERERELAALTDCLQRLAARARTLIEGFYFRSQPIADLARETGLLPITVRTALHRTRLALADCLRRALQAGA